ncbi:MAG: ribosome silencing factor, partial [Actinomycetota bacterium]|nr:ribosome silencing factor [Actinomycetota bacterium]
SKGGDDTVVLEVGKILAITEAFVITSGSNHRQVRTIAEEIEAQVKVGGGPSPLRMEGAQQAEWILLDYGDFVAHVFLDETRRYYDLERLWGDAPRLRWDDAAAVGAGAVGAGAVGVGTVGVGTGGVGAVGAGTGGAGTGGPGTATADDLI